MDTEILFTTAPYSLRGLQPDKSLAVSDLKKVMSHYVSSIEREHPNLRFSGQNYADDVAEKLSIDFRYYVQPYSLEICHPRDLGTLKPITLIGDAAIYPNADNFSF